jgi:hypothetical protein
MSTIVEITHPVTCAAEPRSETQCCSDVSERTLPILLLPRALDDRDRRLEEGSGQHAIDSSGW